MSVLIDVRNWLICKLAGKSPIILNVGVRGPIYVGKRGNGLIKDCCIDGYCGPLVFLDPKEILPKDKEAPDG